MTLFISLLLSGFIILFSSFIRGTTGFGLALTAFPLLSLFLPAKEVVVIVAMVNLLFSIAHIFREKSNINIRTIATIGFFSLLGVFIGFMLLRNVNEKMVRIFTGSVILLSGIAFMKGLSIKIPKISTAYGVASFFGGILAGSITIGGPVVALILAGANVPRERFRSSMSLFFLFSFTFAVTFYWIDNMINREILIHTAAVIPFLIAGLLLGEYFSRHINQKIFRLIVLYLLLIMGSLMIIRSLA